MQAKQTALITGGAGFIGANLTFRLLKKGYSVHILCKKETNLWRLRSIINKIEIHNVSLSDKFKLTKLVKKINPSAILHLAAYGVNSSQNDAGKMIEVNVKSTFNLLEAAKDINYKVFINSGSSSEYGFKKAPMKETDFLEPNGFYSATKASATFLCQVFSNIFNKPIVCVRLFSVYGPYEDKNRLIPTIMRNLQKGKPIQITDEKARHDFIYVDDVLDAFEKIIKNGKKYSGKIFNLGSGKEYTNKEVVEKLFEVAKSKVFVEKGKFEKRKWDSDHWVCDNSLARKNLSWKPRYSLEKGLSRMYKWFTKNQKSYE